MSTVDKETMIHDHQIEIKHNDQQINRYRRDIDNMQKSIRYLEIENVGHSDRVKMLLQTT